MRMAPTLFRRYSGALMVRWPDEACVNVNGQRARLAVSPRLRNERKNAERRERGEQFRRERGIYLKFESTVRPPGGEAGLVQVARWAAITLSSPAPKKAKVKVAGPMPSAVAAAKVARRTPASAATRFTTQNGKIGTSRRNSR